MTVSTSQFLVSVADVFMRDPISDTMILRGSAALSTAFKQTMATQEVRGGFGNQLQFVFQHDKKVDVAIDMANWDESVFALNNGTTISNGLQNYYVEELITLTAGAGTTANTPVGNKVYVQPVGGGVIQTITSTGTSFTVSGGAGKQYRVGYKTSTTVDSVTIAADTIPQAYELTMRAKVFTAAGQSAEMEIIIPSFRLLGNFDVSLTAAGVSSTKIDGSALADATNNYAYVYIKPVSATASYIAIASTPATVSLSVGTPTQQISTYAIRGGLYSNVLVDPAADVTYVSGTPATCSVSASGLIQRVAVGTSLISVTHTVSGLKDYINVTCT